MLYTTFKKGIETFKERHPSVFWKDAIHCSCFGEDKENNIPDLPDDIELFLKSLAIKSNEEEIQFLKDKRLLLEGYKPEYRDCIQDQISHLETQNKLIEEDKNI